MVELVAKRLDADVCSIYLTDTDLKHLTLAATIGLAREAVGTVRLAFGEGLVGYTVERGEPIAIEKAQSHPRFRYFPESGEELYQSLMAAPMVVRDNSIGVLVVQTKEPRRFDHRDIALLTTCAQLIAPVVLNARLLDFVTRPEPEKLKVVDDLVAAGVPMGDGGEPTGERELHLSGIPTSSGVAIGPVYRLEDPLDLSTVEYEPSGDPLQEWRDLEDAIVEARRELESVRSETGSRFGPEFSAVFNIHIQILEDKGLIDRLKEATAASENALIALQRVLDDYRRTFDRIENEFFRERGTDIQDVGKRVMAKLLGVRHHNVPLTEGAIVITHQILPHHFAMLEVERMGAIVAEHGGPTSHGAIFARSLEVPAVTGVEGLLSRARPGELAIVDGVSGQVHLGPDEALVEEYQKAQARHSVAVEHLDALRSRPAESRDGRRVLLTANAGLLNDLALADRHGAEGIGLFRTELLALAQRGFPDEDEQETLYERVALAMHPRPVTIRTLDVGGDKELPNLRPGAEENPQLGWRSIRLALSHRDQFLAQLRAILRATARRNVRILLPMVSCLEELEESKALIDEAKETLRSQGADFDENVPVGVMIEVPAAALTADVLAERCEFFSIGTNDLTQYTLAVDRGNERVAHLYDPLHPGVLKLIDLTVNAAERAGIPVSVCGEMAGDALAVPLLVGLGISELSATPSSIPVVKEIIRALDVDAVAGDARAALAARSAAEVHAIAVERLRRAGLFEHPDIGPWLRGTFPTAD
ncbi:MAG: phosphoenolpyruvate--protein phosphotransferase [Myxococcales bacterium]|nr:phosphoenolpyruvate--protein phosphotransferase [Myxococcales bacterium]